jgi:hypothetical protein
MVTHIIANTFPIDKSDPITTILTPTATNPPAEAKKPITLTYLLAIHQPHILITLT